MEMHVYEIIDFLIFCIFTVNLSLLAISDILFNIIPNKLLYCIICLNILLWLCDRTEGDRIISMVLVHVLINALFILKGNEGDVLSLILTCYPMMHYTRVLSVSQTIFETLLKIIVVNLNSFIMVIFCTLIINLTLKYWNQRPCLLFYVLRMLILSLPLVACVATPEVLIIPVTVLSIVLSVLLCIFSKDNVLDFSHAYYKPPYVFHLYLTFIWLLGS